jgi:hypothetical protein
MPKLFLKTRFVFSLPATFHLPVLSLRARLHSCLLPVRLPACLAAMLST